MAVKEFYERQEGFNTFTNHEGENVRIDPTLAHNVLCLLEAAKKTNGDVVLVVDGEEGSGKSTLARQIGKFLDPTLNEERIEFNPEEAIKAHFRGLPEAYDPKEYVRGTYKGKPWEVIILDESADLDRKKTMSSGSVEFTSFITQSRQLHKVFIVILPNIHILNGYIAEHRAVALISCYKHDRTNMGFYKWYGRKGIRRMFQQDMHRQKLYPKNPLFRGRFSGREAFDITRYNRKKSDALNRYRKLENGKGLGDAVVDARDVLAQYTKDIAYRFVENGYKGNKQMWTLLGIGENTWFELKKEARKKLGVPDKIVGMKARARDVVKRIVKDKKDDDKDNKEIK